MTPKQQIQRAEAFRVMLWQIGGDQKAEHELVESIIDQARSQMVEGPL